MDFRGAVGAQRVQVEPREVYARPAGRFQHAGVTRSGLPRGVCHAVEERGAAVAVRLPGGVVAGGEGEHVLIGAGAQLRQAVQLHRAGVGHQYQLRPGEHQQPRALRELAVVADHGPHLHRARRRVQRGGGEAVPRRQHALLAEVTGVRLGVVEDAPPAPVKERERVARRGPEALEVGDGHGHAEFPGKAAEGGDERAVRRDGEGAQLRQGLRYAVAAAPHLREEGDVGPQLRRPAAGGEAEREVFLRVLTRQQLQQGDSQSGHGRASFFPLSARPAAARADSITRRGAPQGRKSAVPPRAEGKPRIFGFSGKKHLTSAR